MARPTIFNQELADEICRRVISGEILRAICNENHMPSVSTVMGWRHTNPNFKAQYAQAREFQAETIFDEILEIADTPEEGTRTVEDDKGVKVYTGDMLAHRELRIKTRQYILPRINKMMSEKAVLDHTSSDGSMSPLMDEQKAARIAAIYMAAERKRLAAEAALDSDSPEFYDASDLV